MPDLGPSPGGQGEGAPNPLLDLLRGCVVRIDDDGEFAGSGFFVASGEVLTCAHVVDGAKAVTVTLDGQALPASVVPRAVDKGRAQREEDGRLADVALLRIDASGLTHSCVELGLDIPARGREPDILHLSAFSKDTYEAGRVELDGASVTFEDFLGDVLKFKEGQVIRGFSGCPALNTRTGKVCGVVDSTRGERGALGGFAVPISTVAVEFPGLLERNAAVNDGDPSWRDAFGAEATALALRRGDAATLPVVRPPYRPDPSADYSPSELLKPRLGVVALIEREGLQENLMRWRESNKKLDVLLLTGAGGAGKTRLALEECARADRAGWTSGLLSLDSEAIQSEEVDRLVSWPGRLFVAIDYAETRPSFVAALVARLNRRLIGPPVRLILICRQGGTRAQLEKHFAIGDDADSVVAVLKAAEPVGLGDPTHLLDSQRLFRAGVEAFAPYVGGENETSDPRPVSLRNEHFSRPLFVLAAAQLCAKDPDLDVDALGRDEVMLTLIDEHESRYWQRWNDSLGVGLDPELQARTVAVAAMMGAETEEEALALVDIVPGLAGEAAGRRREVALWLSHLYGSGKLTETPAIGPVEPDMVAEALVARECVENESLAGSVLDAAGDAQLTRALNVLTRASAGNEQLAKLMRHALGERLPAVVQHAVDVAAVDSELSAAVELSVDAVRPDSNVAAAAELAAKGGDASLAIKLHSLAIERRRELGGNVEEERAELAKLLNDLAGILDGTGRSAEGAAAIKEGVDLYRELAERNPERYSEYLASALSNLAAILDNNLGRSEEAIVASEEAVKLYRELEKKQSGRYHARLAVSLNNLSNVRDNLGQVAGALQAIEEAVDLYRGLADNNPEEYLSNLAGSLNNLAGVLDTVGRVHEALEVSEEALSIYRGLAEEEPERFVPSLAMSLNNLSNKYSRAEKVEQARPVIEEAVRLYRALAENAPERFAQDLAMALNNRALVFGDSGFNEEAVDSCTEAVRLYRALAEQTPERYLADLASSLNNLSSQLFYVGLLDDAQRAIAEAVELRRGLVRRSPERHLPDLATSLNNLSNILDQLEHSTTARSTIEEAVGIYRQLAEASPERYLADLASSLNNMAAITDTLRLRREEGGNSEEAETGEEAVGIGEEAVKLYRELAGESPERFLPYLAKTLNNASNRLASIGRLDEALVTITEAVELERRLAEESPEQFKPDLAGSLDSFATTLHALDHLDEALAVSEEAVELRRELAARNPGRFVPDLAGSLNNLAIALASHGRGKEPIAGLDRDILVHQQQPVVCHLILTEAKWHLRNRDVVSAIRIVRDLADRKREPTNVAAIAAGRSLLRELRIDDETGFDEAWRESGGDDMPVWLRHPQVESHLIRILFEWIEIAQVGDSQAFLEDHKASLLTDEAEAALEHLTDWRPSESSFVHRLRILRAARSEGVTTPYEAMIESAASRRRRERLVEWLNEPSFERSRDLLNANRDDLLAPEAELDLLATALRAPERSSLYVRIALLALARIDGVEAGYSLLRAKPRRLADGDWVAAGDNPRTLALARLYSGLGGGDGERQFLHAVAAAVAGQPREAEQAIERCCHLLPSWERAEYLRRLDSLADEHPEKSDVLLQLKAKLASGRA